jgi:protein TonB
VRSPSTPPRSDEAPPVATPETGRLRGRDPAARRSRERRPRWPWLVSLAVHGGAVAAALLASEARTGDGRDRGPLALLLASHHVVTTPAEPTPSAPAPPPEPDVAEPADALPEAVAPPVVDRLPAEVDAEPLALEPPERVEVSDVLPIPGPGAPARPRTARVEPPESPSAEEAAPAAPAPRATPAPVPARAAGGSGTPVVLHRVEPVYPAALRGRGASGAVLLHVLVSADGSVGEVRVARTSGEPAFDAAAASALRLWRFRPAALAGWAQITIRFRPA